jgi:hypothetical protein
MTPKRLLGLAALACLAAAPNLAVWRGQVLSAPVIALLLLGVACGGGWLAAGMLGALRAGGRAGAARPAAMSALSVVLALAICMVAYAIVEMMAVSVDLTQEGRRELSPQTVRVLQAMTKEATATCFFLPTDDNVLRAGHERSLQFLRQCQAYSPLLKVEVEDPQLAVARMQALELPMASTIGTIVVHSGARKRVITLEGGSPRLEERQFTNALVNVLRSTEPKVLFLTGHGERRIEDKEGQDGAATLADALRRESYAVESFAIKLTAPEVPADADIVVINQPAGDLHEKEVAALQAFLDRGGRLLVLVEPWVRVQSGAAGEQLRPWLERDFGIRIGADIVLSESQENHFTAALSGDDRPFAEVDKGFGEFRGCYAAGHPITRGFDQNMLLHSARTVRLAPKLPQGLSGVELLRTTPDFWAERDVETLSASGKARASAEEPREPQPLAVAVSAAAGAPIEGRPKDARVVVVGDADFVSNAQLTPVAGHLNFILNTFAWMSESEELIAIRPSGKTDPAIVLRPGERRAIIWISSLFTVQAVVIAGIAALWLRRRHQ